MNITFLRFWLQVFGELYGVRFDGHYVMESKTKTNKYSYIRDLLIVIICELLILNSVYHKNSTSFLYLLTFIASFNLIYNRIKCEKTI